MLYAVPSSMNDKWTHRCSAEEDALIISLREVVGMEWSEIERAYFAEREKGSVEKRHLRRVSWYSLIFTRCQC